MQITGGELKRRRIETLPGLLTRPTPSMLREAVFNIVQGCIEDAHFLDLFAGSGILSFEALSRGSAHATLIEKNPAAARIIKKNIQSLNLEEKTTLHIGDIFDKLELLVKQGARFDMIYADPPYKQGLGEKLIHFLDQSALLKPNGIFFLEEGLELKIATNNLSAKPVRKYGHCFLHQFL